MRCTWMSTVLVSPAKSISGVDVCRMLTERYRIPIIMLTARGNVEDKLYGLEGEAFAAGVGALYLEAFLFEAVFQDVCNGFFVYMKKTP